MSGHAQLFKWFPSPIVRARTVIIIITVTVSITDARRASHPDREITAAFVVPSVRHLVRCSLSRRVCFFCCCCSSTFTFRFVFVFSVFFSSVLFCRSSPTRSRRPFRNYMYIYIYIFCRFGRPCRPLNGFVYGSFSTRRISILPSDRRLRIMYFVRGEKNEKSYNICT